MKKAALQSAADQAAISAISAFNSSSSAYAIEAKGVAAAMGFVNGQNGVTVTVNRPPATGPNAGKTSAVEVIVSVSQPPMLSALMHPANYVIDGRAVASFGGGPGCVLALDSTASGAVSAGGNTTVSMPNCDLVANSSASDALHVYGSASVTVDAASVVGGITATSGLVDNRNVTGAPSASNPYAGLTVPSTSTCGPGDTGGASLSRGTYCSGLTVNAGRTVTLSAGTYVFAGGTIKLNGGTISGTGVTLVLTSSGGKKPSYASITINGNATVNLTAPTTGAFKGVVLFDDPNDTGGTLKLNGTANTYFGGAIVAPGASVNFSGTGVSGNGHNCTQIVADTVTFTGNSTIGSDCSSYGTASINGAGKAALSE